MGEIREGDVVLDLGSGAGFDCFLAAKKVGLSGRVIGVDMSEEMVERARANADKYGYKNVEFRLGDIEELPVKDNSIDIIISNCVINLAPDKSKVFSEAHRVLKKGGKMYISDIVLLKNLSKEQKGNEELIAGCVGGALLKNDYLGIVKKAEFKVKILSEDKDISKRQYQGIPLESLKIEIQNDKEKPASGQNKVRADIFQVLWRFAPRTARRRFQVFLWRQILATLRVAASILKICFSSLSVDFLQ